MFLSELPEQSRGCSKLNASEVLGEASGLGPSVHPHAGTGVESFLSRVRTSDRSPHTLTPAPEQFPSITLLRL